GFERVPRLLAVAVADFADRGRHRKAQRGLREAQLLDAAQVLAPVLQQVAMFLIGGFRTGPIIGCAHSVREYTRTVVRTLSGPRRGPTEMGRKVATDLSPSTNLPLASYGARRLLAPRTGAEIPGES